MGVVNEFNHFRLLTNAIMAKHMCSWKRFYNERKVNYKTKFPFLKEDQVTAKLKRIWNKKGKNVCEYI